MICGEQTLDALCFMSTKKKARIDDEAGAFVIHHFIDYNAERGAEFDWLNVREEIDWRI